VRARQVDSGGRARQQCRRRPESVGTTLVGLILTVLLLAAGCSSSAPLDPRADSTIPDSTIGDDAVKAAEIDDPTPPPVDWQPCEGGLDCATLTVPLDYTDPGSGIVDLALVRRRATDPATRIGSLVVNPGGPGGSGVQMIRDKYGVNTGLNTQFDLVSWDPRGVGASTPLTCGTNADAFVSLNRQPTSSAGQATLDSAAAALAADCANHAGPLLDHVDTVTTARDVEQLRRTLREDQLSFAGYSYGTAIGLAYLERYPARVRALVLDGIVQPEWDLEALLGAQASGFDRAIDLTFDRCDSNSTCPVHDSRATYKRVSANLAREPFPLGPNAEFGATDLAVAALSSAYDPARAAVFVQGLANADAGDAGVLEGLVEQYRTAVKSYASYAAVVCTDLPHPSGADAYQALVTRVTARSPRFGAAIANEMLPCAFWSAATTGRPHSVYAPSAPPVLLVGTTGDPATPYSSAEAVAAGLPTSVLLTDDGPGHTSGGRSDCVDAAVQRYLLNLTLPARGTRCSGGS
jgi:pimeloyl-ACP methyl ester carboxylesterase